MYFRSLKREPIPELGATAYVLEPTAGTLSTFSQKVMMLPEVEPGTGRVPVYQFNILKLLCCLHDENGPVVSQIINHLHNTNPEVYKYEVQEGVSIRQTFEDYPPEALPLLFDYFMDNFPGTLLSEIIDVINDKVWVEKIDEKN